MAFQTPLPNREQQQPVSLLFSPSIKATDGQKGRTPLTTPGLGRGFASREQSTPPSRRRSLTPASGGTHKETPPPPPSGSLLDSPGAVPMPPAWGHRTFAETGVEDMNISPIGGGGGGAQPQPAATPSQQQFEQQLQREYALASRALRDYGDTWVTVFGFGQADVPLVLREFGNCGDIAQFGTYGDGPAVNWMHICYANKHAAQRALLRSGDQLSTSCMVGVKALEPGKREALEQQGAAGAAAARTPALPRPARSRPYQLDAAAAQQAVVPLASKSAWEKVSEFILGL